MEDQLSDRYKEKRKLQLIKKAPHLRGFEMNVLV